MGRGGALSFCALASPSRRHSLRHSFIPSPLPPPARIHTHRKVTYSNPPPPLELFQRQTKSKAAVLAAQRSSPEDIHLARKAAELQGKMAASTEYVQNYLVQDVQIIVPKVHRIKAPPEHLTVTVNPFVPTDHLLRLYQNTVPKDGDVVLRVADNVVDLPYGSGWDALLSDDVLKSQDHIQDVVMYGLEFGQLISDEAIDFCLNQLRLIYRDINFKIISVAALNMALEGINSDIPAPDKTALWIGLHEQLEGARYLIMPCNMGLHYWCMIYDNTFQHFYVYDSLNPRGNRGNSSSAETAKNFTELVKESGSPEAKYTLCESDSQKDIPNGCGYFLIHNTHRFLNYVRKSVIEEKDPAVLPKSIISPDICGLPLLTPGLTRNWGVRLMRAMRFEVRRKCRNLALANPDTVLDTPPESAARFSPKAYETPPDRAGIQTNYMDVRDGGALTMQYTAECGWATVRKAWQDNDVAGVLFRVPHDDAAIVNGHSAWVVRYEQTAYIGGIETTTNAEGVTRRRTSRLSPLASEAVAAQLEVFKKNPTFTVERQEPVKSQLSSMVANNSVKIMITAEDNGTWIRLGAMQPVTEYRRANIRINNSLQLNTAYAGTAKLSDIAVIQVGQTCRFVWVQKNMASKPVPEMIPYEPIKLLNWLTLDNIILPADAAREFKDDLEIAQNVQDQGMTQVNSGNTVSRARSSAGTRRGKSLRGRQARPPRVRGSGDPTGAATRDLGGIKFQTPLESLSEKVTGLNDSAFLVFTLFDRLLHQAPASGRAEAGHFHHHHYPETLIEDHFDRINFYCIEHPEKFPWTDKYPAGQRTAGAMLEICHEAIIGDGKVQGPWDRMMRILELGIAAYYFWGAAREEKSGPRTRSCTALSCAAQWKKLNDFNNNPDPEINDVYEAHLWSYGSPPCTETCQARALDCLPNCAIVHRYAFDVNEDFFDALPVEDTNLFNLKKKGFAGLSKERREEIQKLVSDRYNPPEMKLDSKARATFPPLFWMPVLGNAETFWDSKDGKGHNETIVQCETRLQLWLSKGPREREQLWNIQEMYYERIRNVRFANQWHITPKDARQRACLDMEFAKAHRFSRVMHPLVSVFLHIKRKAENEHWVDPAKRQRLEYPVD
ncbi:hypothetical protein DFH27DRAFT_599804 [Peziza echinospora]|nr:hypothetical protein DFH27DRAFT_599804 [Peziza echinospora]